MTTRNAPAPVDPRLLRRTVLVVAGLNLGYFFVEAAVAVVIGSVSLLADSVDFLEDTSINLLIALALGWSLSRRALAGHVMALVILVPAAAAAWQVVSRFGDPTPPSVWPLVLTAGGAALVNGTCAVILSRVRSHGGSLSAAAFLSARSDVLVNLAIIAMGVVTVLTRSGWPDLVLGAAIVVVNGSAALEVWRLAGEERFAARALAGEDLDD
ncbi:cation transporter [Oryzobacter sp. R7]|uniref:cation transporter n=1 Tax=Oryzobacter faecalis TaxID=3388656 RepID=UPI00398D5BB9